MSCSLRDQLPCFTASFLSADAEKEQRPPTGEGLRHKRCGVSSTFRIFTSHPSVSLVTQRQLFPLRAFNRIYCSDMTDVCVRPFSTIDEYCAATRAGLFLEGNW